MAISKIPAAGLADIAAAVEGASDSNTFTNAESSKLNAIEASATTDQTKSDIESLSIALPAANLTGTINNSRIVGSNLTALNATQLTSGTVPAARLLTATTQSASDNSTKIATTAYTDAQVATVVDSAPGTLNTLNELAEALGDDANYATTTATAIAAKLPLAGGAMTGTITNFRSTGIDDNADATAITIDSAEKVGIGTTSPLNGLQIGSAFPITINGNYPDIHFNSYYSAPNYRPVTTGFASRLSFHGGTGKLTLSTGASSTTAGSNYSPVEIFGVDKSGNITLTGTVDGVDIQTLNTTASAALPKAGYTGTTVLNMANAKYQGGDVASGARMTLKYLNSDPALKLIGGGSSTTLELLTGNNSSNYAIKVVDENTAATVFSVRKDGGAETSGLYDMHLTGKITGAVGSVLQVKEAETGVQVNFANDWSYDDVIAMNITPSSTSSKIYVLALIDGASAADGGNGIYPGLKARVLAGPVAQFSNHATTIVEIPITLYHDNNQVHRVGQISLQCIDSPSSTAEQKYQLQAGNSGGSSQSGTYTGSINRNAARTKLLLLEIGA